MLRAPATRLGLLCLAATLACKPDPVPSTNPEPNPDAGGPTSDAPSEPVVDTPEPPAAAEVEAPAETDDVDDGEDGEDETGVAEADAGGETKAAPAGTVAKAEREPLPKPTYKLSGPKCQQNFNVGTKVKSFRLPSVDGQKTISSSGYRNRVVLLNFWGTWCKPCLKELPEFDRLYRKYRKHGLTLVAVATDEDAEPVQAFIDKHKLKAKVALEGEDVAGAYNRPNFPFSFVVDGSGKIIAAYEYIDESCMGDLEQVIRDELDKLDR